MTIFKNCTVMDITHCSQVQWKKTVLELNYMCLNNQMTAKECVILKPKVHAKPMCIDKAVALLSNYYSIVLDFFFSRSYMYKEEKLLSFIAALTISAYVPWYNQCRHEIVFNSFSWGNKSILQLCIIFKSKFLYSLESWEINFSRVFGVLNFIL